MKESRHPDHDRLQSPEAQPLTQQYRSDLSVEHVEKDIHPRGRWARFSGWRGGLILASWIMFLVLTLNFIIAIVAATKWRGDDNVSTAFYGDCDVANRWVKVAHLLVNVLSSLLLGASNYCMQRLVAPTREEIDNAHAKRKWLDIGKPSLRNLSSITKTRLVFWIVLVGTSLLIHLLYNSVFFLAIGAYQTQVYIVNDNFFTQPLDTNWTTPAQYQEYFSNVVDLQKDLLNGQYLNTSAWSNVSQIDCVLQYNAQFASVGPGFIVTPNASFAFENHTLDFKVGSDQGQAGTTLWRNLGDIEYCLVQNYPKPLCAVQTSRVILPIIIGCNIIKLSVMVFVLWRLSTEVPLVTVGDAIDSFIQTPDPTTEDLCLLSKRNVKDLWDSPNDVRLKQSFTARKKERWGSACNTRQWVGSFILYLGVIGTGFGLLGRSGYFGGGGIGETNINNLTQAHHGVQFDLLPEIILANMPQIFISLLALLYNGQFTTMLAHREWSNYAIKRRTLRVSNPTANQRSTFYLQLPYLFSVPLLLSVIFLHWVVSQSLFLVRWTAFSDTKLVNGRVLSHGLDVAHAPPNEDWLTTLQYSSVFILTGLAWAGVLVLVLLGVAFFAKYPVGLPAGGTNSAVISAACHVGPEQREKGFETHRPLQWGVTVPGSEDVVGHCSFSSGPVGSPEPGCLYAGNVPRRRREIRG